MGLDEISERDVSVHPSFVVWVFAELVRVDVAAVFVEMDFAILLAHVDLELAGGAAAFPAIVVVAEAEEAFAETEGEATAWSEFDVKESAKRAGELEERAEAVGLLEKDGDGDENVDGNHVLGLDANEEPEEKFLVPEDHGNGDEHTEDSGPATSVGGVGTEAEDMSERDGRGKDSSAHDGGEVKLAEPAAAEGWFEKRAGKPEGEHAEEDGKDAGIDKGVGDELPDFSVNHGERFEEEVGEKSGCKMRSDPSEKSKSEEGGDVGEDELASYSGKGWEAERDGSGARHGVLISSCLGMIGFCGSG